MPESTETNFWITPLHLFANLPVQCWCKCNLVFCLVLRRVNVGRIHSLITKDLKIDWSIQVTWKPRALVKLDLFQHMRWCSSTKADKCSSCYLSEQVVYFQQQINVLFWVIIYIKVGVLKALFPIHRKTTVLESLFN